MNENNPISQELQQELDNEALYLDPLNSFILCSKCESVWTNEDKTTMRIYPESEQRRVDINHKYYC